MIVRIVRMHFTEEGVEKFLTIFQANRDAIRNFQGCTHLELLRDLHNAHVFTTISHWENADSLERYRNSQLFASVWGRVKILFSERTQAYTLENFYL